MKPSNALRTTHASGHSSSSDTYYSNLKSLDSQTQTASHHRKTERISPPSGLALLNPNEIWRFRELMLFLAWRDIMVRYKQTMVGAAWAIFQPLTMMVILTVVLGRLARLPTNNVPYPLFVFCGILPWTFFAAAISNAANSVVGSEKLVTKVYFPRLIIPLASIGSAVIDVCVASCLLIALLVWYQGALSLTLLVAPACLLAIAAIAIGIGSFLAALNVTYRDFRLILPFMIQLWLFATPSIFLEYAAPSVTQQEDKLSYWLAMLLQFNPLITLISAFRHCALGQPVEWIGFSVAALTSVVIMISGCLYFRYVEHQFADVI